MYDKVIFMGHKIRKLIKVSLFVLFVFINSSCDPVDRREFKVRNNTKGDIYWLFSENGTFKNPLLGVG